MSNIAEQKALEVYPELEGTETYFDRDYICTKPIDLNRQKRTGYIHGYDQAMQDFMEKACEWLEETFLDNSHNSGRGFYGEIVTHDFDNIQDMLEKFKQAMED